MVRPYILGEKAKGEEEGQAGVCRGRGERKGMGNEEENSGNLNKVLPGKKSVI